MWAYPIPGAGSIPVTRSFQKQEGTSTSLSNRFTVVERSRNHFDKLSVRSYAVQQVGVRLQVAPPLKRLFLYKFNITPFTFFVGKHQKIHARRQIAYNDTFFFACFHQFKTAAVNIAGVFIR